MKLASASELPVTWRSLLSYGLLAVVVGMCLFPTGPSFNPSKPYQYLLGVTLYLPAVIMGCRRPRAWLQLLRHPLMQAVLAMFAWACISLFWTNARRPHDELLRMLTVLLFLFACVHALGGDLRRQWWLLVGAAAVLAATAVVAMLRFTLSPPPDGRMAGFGVMANANLFAAAMSAGILWLWPWRCHSSGMRAGKWLLLALMAVALVLTQSRSAWVALFVSLFVLLATRDRQRAWQRALVLCIVAAGFAVVAYPELSARGLSFRPQILACAIDLFLQHPWRGMGLGAEFVIPVEGGTGGFQVHTHNLFSQLAVELGIPGLLLWSATWLGLGWYSWHDRHDEAGRMVFGLWLFASIMVQFDLPHLVDSPRPGWLILWLPLGLAMARSLPAATEFAPR